MPVVADNSDDDYDDYEFIIKNENTQTSSRKATDRCSNDHYEYKERVEAHTIYVPPKLLQPH
jgi:hypothetical protein